MHQTNSTLVLLLLALSTLTLASPLPPHPSSPPALPSLSSPSSPPLPPSSPPAVRTLRNAESTSLTSWTWGEKNDGSDLEDKDDDLSLGEQVSNYVVCVCYALLFSATAWIWLRSEGGLFTAAAGHQSARPPLIKRLFWSAVLINSLLRALWFGVPDSAFHASYRPTNARMDEHRMGVFVQDVIKGGGDVAFFTAYLLIVYLWASTFYTFSSPSAALMPGASSSSMTSGQGAERVTAGRRHLQHVPPVAETAAPVDPAERGQQFIESPKAFRFFVLSNIVVYTCQLFIFVCFFLFNYYTVIMIMASFLGILSLVSAFGLILFGFLLFSSLRPLMHGLSGRPGRHISLSRSNPDDGVGPVVDSAPLASGRSDSYLSQPLLTSDHEAYAGSLHTDMYRAGSLESRLRASQRQRLSDQTHRPSSGVLHTEFLDEDDGYTPTPPSALSQRTASPEIVTGSQSTVTPTGDMSRGFTPVASRTSPMLIEDPYATPPKSPSPQPQSEAWVEPVEVGGSVRSFQPPPTPSMGSKALALKLVQRKMRNIRIVASCCVVGCLIRAVLCIYEVMVAASARNDSEGAASSFPELWYLYIAVYYVFAEVFVSSVVVMILRKPMHAPDQDESDSDNERRSSERYHTVRISSQRDSWSRATSVSEYSTSSEWSEA